MVVTKLHLNSPASNDHETNAEAAFYQPNNNTEIPDEDTDNEPASERVAPTMHVRDSTPDPIAAASPSPATPIQALGPISQPLPVSRGQASVPQRAPGSTSIQDADVNLADKNGQTPLMSATLQGHLTTVQALLGAPKIAGRTPDRR